MVLGLNTCWSSRPWNLGFLPAWTHRPHPPTPLNAGWPLSYLGIRYFDSFLDILPTPQFRAPVIPDSTRIAEATLDDRTVSTTFFSSTCIIPSVCPSTSISITGPFFTRVPAHSSRYPFMPPAPLQRTIRPVAMNIVGTM